MNSSLDGKNVLLEDVLKDAKGVRVDYKQEVFDMNGKQIDVGTLIVYFPMLTAKGTTKLVPLSCKVKDVETAKTLLGE